MTFYNFAPPLPPPGRREAVAKGRRDPWGRGEDALLRALVAAGKTYPDVAAALGRTPKAVAHRAQALGLSRPRRLWSRAEDQAVIEAAEQNRRHGVDPARFGELAARFGRSREAVIQRARTLGARSRRRHLGRRPWGRDEDNALRRARRTGARAAEGRRRIPRSRVGWAERSRRFTRGDAPSGPRRWRPRDPGPNPRTPRSGAPPPSRAVTAIGSSTVRTVRSARARGCGRSPSGSAAATRRSGSERTASGSRRTAGRPARADRPRARSGWAGVPPVRGEPWFDHGTPARGPAPRRNGPTISYEGFSVSIFNSNRSASV